MTPRLLGQPFIFGIVFFLSEYPLGIERQKRLKKFKILTRKPQSQVRINIDITTMAFLTLLQIGDLHDGVI